VYRSLTPASLLLDNEGQIQLGSFGLAKRLGTSTSGVSSSQRPEFCIQDTLAELMVSRKKWSDVGCPPQVLEHMLEPTHSVQVHLATWRRNNCSI
jgi:serine/threonine protein kinase